MTTARKLILAGIRVAVYHGDQKTAVRLYTENRISRAAFNSQWALGAKQKADGMPCACPACKTTTTTTQAP